MEEAGWFSCHWPTDKAIGTNDALFISDWRGGVIWFLTRGKLLEARKLATLVGK